MCDDYQGRAAAGRVKSGKLYGIGIGPGDPGLLTLKAKEIISKVDILFCPKGHEEGISLARSMIEQGIARKSDFVELTFPMTRDPEILKEHWQKAARKIAGEVKKGKEAAFITLGDPFIYSTYIYLLRALRREYPDLEVETVPGISAFNAAAAKAGIPLVQGDERLAILPVTKDLKGLREAFGAFDTVILMKVGTKLDKVLTLLKELDLLKNSVMISRLGQPKERIINDLSSLKGEKRGGYFSVIIVKVPPRET